MVRILETESKRMPSLTLREINDIVLLELLPITEKKIRFIPTTKV